MILSLENGFIYMCVYADGVYREVGRQHLGVGSPRLLVGLGD